MSNRSILPNDYLKLRFVEDIQVSANYVVYVQTVSNSAKRSYKSQIQLLDKNTGKLIQFTNGSARDYHPRISPDESKLAFISTRNDKPRLFVMPILGGEALAVTTKDLDLVDFSWSPDSTKIAFRAKVDLDYEIKDESRPLTLFEVDRIKAEKREKERVRNDPKIISNLVYRTGTSYLNENKFAHIFVFTVETQETMQVTQGSYSFSDASWETEKDLLAITIRGKPIELEQKLTLVRIASASRKETDLFTYVHPMYLFTKGPVISPKGRIVLDVVDTNFGFQGQNSQLGLYHDGSYKIINSHLDRSVINFDWLDENSGIMMVEDSGKAEIHQYDFNTATFTKLFETDLSITSFGCVNSEEIYFTATGPNHPFAVWKWDKTHGQKLVADPNTEFVAGKDVILPEEFWLTNPEGVKFQGWFFDAGLQDGKKPALCLSVHGGPHVMWNNAGSMWHEWQVFLAQGYSIIAMNPIGSSGYGQEFSQLITSKWGIDDARDLLLALDHFSDRVDENRLYVTGGSYAGFQTANLISRDHRFKAACAQRGVFNLVSFWATTDIPLFSSYEWEGEVWDRLDVLWEHSPFARAKDIETPLLIIHSENDFRVSVSQAEELFAALKLQKKEAMLIKYPRDGHELSRSGEPLHVIDRLDRMIEWFNSHT